MSIEPGSATAGPSSPHRYGGFDDLAERPDTETYAKATRVDEIKGVCVKDKSKCSSAVADV